MATNDDIANALVRDQQLAPRAHVDPYEAMKRAALIEMLTKKPAMQQQHGMGEGMMSGGMDALNSMGEMGGGGGIGGASSPWDMAFTGLGSLSGGLQGNDPSTPGVPHGREKTGDEWLIKAGAPIGGAVGSMFGFGGSGSMAGQNVGATLADLKAGNINNLGMDVSANLPPLPGMQQPGWKGLVNGATGLPFGTLFGKMFG